MKRIALLSIVVLALFAGCISQQDIVTDKVTYTQGEEVKITWSKTEIGLTDSCSGMGVIIEQETANGWQYVQRSVYRDMGFACVDGMAKNTGLYNDVCYGPVPVFDTFSQGEYTWNMRIYTETGWVDECDVPEGWPDDDYMPEQWMSYTTVTAPPGRYKAKYGNAERIFTICTAEGDCDADLTPPPSATENTISVMDGGGNSLMVCNTGTGTVDAGRLTHTMESGSITKDENTFEDCSGEVLGPGDCCRYAMECESGDSGEIYGPDVPAMEFNC